MEGSLKLVDTFKSYTRKQTWVFFLNTDYNSDSSPTFFRCCNCDTV